MPADHSKQSLTGLNIACNENAHCLPGIPVTSKTITAGGGNLPRIAAFFSSCPDASMRFDHSSS